MIWSLLIVVHLTHPDLVRCALLDLWTTILREFEGSMGNNYGSRSSRARLTLTRWIIQQV